MQLLTATVYIAWDSGWWTGENCRLVADRQYGAEDFLATIREEIDMLRRMYRIAKDCDVGIYLEYHTWEGSQKLKGKMAKTYRLMMDGHKMRWTFDRNPQPDMVTDAMLEMNDAQALSTGL